MSETATETAPAGTDDFQQQLLSVGTLMHKLSRDPKHRKEVLRLLKAADPSIPMPELDLEETAAAKADEKVAPLAEQLKGVLTEFSKLKTDIARERWRQETGLDEDELVEVETLAKEVGITKAETAVDYWRNKQLLGTPRGSRRNRTADQYLTELSKINPRNQAALKGAAFQQADRVLKEMRGRRMAG